MIDALANRLADAFIRALRPKLAALMDEQINRARQEIVNLADPVTDQIDKLKALRKWIP